MTTLLINADYPGGKPLAKKIVCVELHAGSAGGSDQTTVIGSTRKVQLDAQGHAELDLIPNSELSPANTYYRIYIERALPNINRTIALEASTDSPISWADSSIQVDPAVLPALNSVSATASQVTIPDGDLDGLDPDLARAYIIALGAALSLDEAFVESAADDYAALVTEQPNEVLTALRTTAAILGSLTLTSALTDERVDALEEAGGGGVTVHADLTGRSAADQHPISAITGLQAALSAEATARAAADTTLTTAVTTEASARTSADTTLSTDIASEATARAAAVTAEATARANAVSAEASTRAAADTTLSTTLATEISDRESSYDALQDAINAAIAAEASARATAISTAIANVLGGAPDAFNTLLELADEAQDQAADLAALLSVVSTKETPAGAQAKVDIETTARAAALSAHVAAVDPHGDRGYADTVAAAAQAYAIQRSHHTGTQSLDTTTDSGTRVAMTPAERTKLSGVATSATANDTDANLRARSSHTGTQAQSTVDNLVSDLAAKALDTRLVSAGTGLTGGGDLTADRTLAVAYGTSSGTAAQGNDSRFNDYRAPWIAGNYYGHEGLAVQNGSNNLVSGQVKAMPFYNAVAKGIDRLVADSYVGVALATSYLYICSDTNGYPGTVLVSGSITPTASSAYHEATVSYTLPRGLLWFVCHGTGPTWGPRALTGQSPLLPTNTLSSANVPNCWNLSGGAGTSLLTSFPAGASLAATGVRMLVRST